VVEVDSMQCSGDGGVILVGLFKLENHLMMNGAQMCPWARSVMRREYCFRLE